MRNLLSILLTSIVAVFTINYLVLAWNEPTASPPNDNVAAPLNVSGGRQTKVGDITLNNLKATSITLGEDTRFAWPGGSGNGGCNWEGMICRCKVDAQNQGRMVVGLVCRSGVVTDLQAISFQVSPSGSASCPVAPPAIWGCNAGYTRK